MAHSIREADPADLQAILQVHVEAFGQNAEADLVRDLLDDPTAQPVLSLVAELGGRIQGHVLFTAVRLTDTASECSAAILAPLAGIA